jgi:HD superfamily phosphohydrolase
MTELLQRAFERASQLPDRLQDEVAERLLEDLEGEAVWDETLAASSDVLDRLADQALAEHRVGKTEKKGFDEL